MGNKRREKATRRRREEEAGGKIFLEGFWRSAIPIHQLNSFASKLSLCKAGSMYTEIEKSHQLYLSYYGIDIYNNGFLKQTLMPWYCFKIEKI